MNKTKKIRHLRAKIEDLRAELNETSTELEDRADEAMFAKMSAADWRTKYEQLCLTPEIKADTEAAFKRGVEHARKAFTAYLIDTLQSAAVPQEGDK